MEDYIRQSFSQCYSCISERKDHLKYLKEKRMRGLLTHTHVPNFFTVVQDLNLYSYDTYNCH